MGVENVIAVLMKNNSFELGTKTKRKNGRSNRKNDD